MDLPSVVNAPRLLELNGATYRARALTLGQLGEVLAWLEDRLPKVTEPEGPVRFSSQASRLALTTTEGLAVLLHLSLGSCHPTLTRDDALAIAATMDVDDESRLQAIAFRRSPSSQARNDPRVLDLAESDWSLIFAHLTGRCAAFYEAAATLTLDQLDHFLNRGESQARHALTIAEVQAMWDAAAPSELTKEAGIG